jgi:hypothetical protein
VRSVVNSASVKLGRLGNALAEVEEHLSLI